MIGHRMEVAKRWGKKIARRIIKEKPSERFERQCRKMRHPCSCYMCGNPRRHFGEITMQERKNLLKNRDFE